MTEILNTLEFVQSHGGMLLLFMYSIMELRYLRRDVDVLMKKEDLI